MSKTTYFEETQRLGPLGITILVLSIAVMTNVMAYLQLIQGQAIGNNPPPDWAMVLIWISIGLGLPLVLISSRLSIKVDDKGVHYQLVPFQWKIRTLDKSIIREAAFKEYKPLRDYGGWGVRVGMSGNAVTVKGHEGVLFQLKNNRSLLIGSQKATEFAAAVDKYMENSAPLPEKE